MLLRRASRFILELPQTRALRDVRTVEPQYLKLLEPALPVYEGLLNIQLKGYDFPIVEQQTRRVEKFALKFGLEISEVWATPLQNFRVQTYVSQSTVPKTTYTLPVYERNVQLRLVPGAHFGTFLDVLQKNMAEGVKLSVHQHLPEHTELREIPDLELESLEKQLEELVSPGANPHSRR